MNKTHQTPLFVHIIYVLSILAAIIVGMFLNRRENSMPVFSYQPRYLDHKLYIDSRRSNLGISIPEFMALRSKVDKDDTVVLIDGLLDMFVLDTKDRILAAPVSSREALLNPIRHLAEYRKNHPRMLPAESADANSLVSPGESEREEVDAFLLHIPDQ